MARFEEVTRLEFENMRLKETLKERLKEERINQARHADQAERMNLLLLHQISENQQFCRALWDSFVAGNEAYEPVGQELRRWFDSLLQSLWHGKRVCEAFREHGFPLPSEESIRQALFETEQRRDQIFLHWPSTDNPFPPANHERIERALTEYRRGEHQDLREVIRALESQNPPVNQ
jgi:hypothetical protein